MGAESHLGACNSHAVAGVRFFLSVLPGDAENCSRAGGGGAATSDGTMDDSESELEIESENAEP